MRIATAIVAGAILSATPALAVSNTECYETTRAVVVDLFDGLYTRLGAPPSDAPAGWADWFAMEFPTDSPLKSFSVIDEEHRGDGCQARIHVETVGGQVIVLFIDLDRELHPTRLRSLREVLEDRMTEMTEALERIREVVPTHAKRDVDEAGLRQRLRRLREIARESDQDITNFVVTLKGNDPEWSTPKHPTPSPKRKSD
jgi:hypothetical protein